MQLTEAPSGASGGREVAMLHPGMAENQLDNLPLTTKLSSHIAEPATDLHLAGFYLSHFTRPKPGGSKRLIANLKPLNRVVLQCRYKMLEASQV